jgi:hypothetical protein
MNHDWGRQTKHQCQLCTTLSVRGRFIPFTLKGSKSKKKKKLWAWVCASCLGWGI